MQLSGGGDIDGEEREQGGESPVEFGGRGELGENVDRYLRLHDSAKNIIRNSICIFISTCKI